MSNKKITDLASYTSNQVQPTDLLFITDIAHQETKKITAADLANYGAGYVNYRTGSYSGSLMGVVTGSLYGTASWANNLTYPNNSTASYSITSSYSNYSNTSSYALSIGVTNFGEIINQTNHGFSIGDCVYESGTSNSRTFYRASSTFFVNNPANEVVGIVQSTSSADIFTIAYTGIVNFGTNLPSYYQGAGNTFNGVAYFLSGSTGKLNSVDPSMSDNTQISKPILLKLDNTRGLLINQRGVYENTGSQISAVSASYAMNSSYSDNAITASYALNGGSGGSGITYVD
jgi:hypothetical protein